MKIQFDKSKDQDYPTKYDYVVVFQSNENYIIKGKTHGILSHSIKHLIEIDKDFVETRLRSIKSFIESQNYLVYKKDSGFKNLELNDKILLNTLDLINDKILLNEPLLKPELEIKNRWLFDIKNKYISEMNKILNSSKYLDSNFWTKLKLKHESSSQDIVNFEIEFKNAKFQHYIDFKRMILITVYKNIIKTCFRTTRNYLQNLYNGGSIKYYNRDFEEWLKERIMEI